MDFPRACVPSCQCQKRRSGIIHFPETQILGSGFRAHVCQSWRLKPKVSADHFHGAMQFSLRKLVKTETFFLKEQQNKLLKAVAIEKKGVC